MTPPRKILRIRNAAKSDVPRVAELYKRVYPDSCHYSHKALEGQIRNFPEGVFVAIADEEIVGYCATLLKTEGEVWTEHTWRGITGGGHGEGHDPKGRWLYGYEIFVDPTCRRQGVGYRLYRARADLCQRQRFKGIAICGRLPLLRKRLSSVGTPQAYVRAVQENKIPDPTFHFQARQGFKFQKVMPGYLPVDEESLGYAASMVWRNPDVPVAQSATDR